ncbi:hypothetical protein GQ53DRAFT_425617 [Thozetella sp. PMI_491]|nr:hypothetical protein GQ53DRAFT_425617 [Thozetella sp. PMI_491]
MVAITTFAATLGLVASVLALPTPIGIDENAAGAQNVGNGKGLQFITGQCFSNADCASTCCATKNGAGVCSGVDVANVDGKTGCGFVEQGGVAAVPAPPAASLAGNTIDTSAAGAQNVGNGKGQQFITGQCFSNADCASTCCANKNGAGVCSGVDVANVDGKSGCGFVAQGGVAAVPAELPATTPATTPATNTGNMNTNVGTGSSSGAKPVVTSPINTSAAGAQNVGTGKGQQFITGQCLSDADCASTCCATKGAAGVCSAVAVSTVDGKTGCGFQGVAA